MISSTLVGVEAPAKCRSEESSPSTATVICAWNWHSLATNKKYNNSTIPITKNNNNSINNNDSGGWGSSQMPKWRKLTKYCHCYLCSSKKLLGHPVPARGRYVLHFLKTLLYDNEFEHHNLKLWNCSFIGTLGWLFLCQIILSLSQNGLWIGWHLAITILPGDDK